ncbi:glycerophosphoryl diester phosphodiesterase [Streptosporangium becharense]|uniref:Glycerophosphoryl diester phosphodiesterase n=1 Tax=Streptosporangium becharense TaxID=1816182 RepID=A0A7W9MJD6_9ACTN|nr:glycerophosphodiester phosphodiesterase family protein [Streptosporangium becharense]MBB2911719.1 glycerophosphoryl diester phosphodiesterase [Streptosporangium becharense]MBB5822463.1 glycerophosphoryl diester phosphodiesterase [Streptosporangium becharense]
MFRRLGLILATTLTTLMTLLTIPPATAPAAASAPPSRITTPPSRVTAPPPGIAAPSRLAAPPLRLAAPPAVLNVAHRGASAYAPENTVAAFELAREQRADMFELDVQQTKDHKLVLMHDTTLARTTDVERLFPDRAPWRVGDLTLAEIRRLDAGSWFSPEYEGEPVPTLGEALRAMDGSGLGLLLEVKAPHLYPGIEGRVAAELRRNASWLRPGRLVVQSFDWNSMRRFHRVMPRVPVGLLGTPAAARLPELARFASQINPPYRDLTAEYVRRVHSHRMDVLAWTVDDPATMRRLISYRVDGIITNRPGTLRALLSPE